MLTLVGKSNRSGRRIFSLDLVTKSLTITQRSVSDGRVPREATIQVTEK